MIISQTPLRVSFLGGGTDYPEYFLKHGGAVLGTAVDKFAFFSMSPFYSALFDYSIRISYRQVECVRSLDEIAHAPFRECLRWAGVSRDVEINHAAELPAFTGLGSSSAFVVGLLSAIHAFHGRQVAPLELAYQAIEIEREVLKESVGCQDQTFAAVGGFNVIEFRGRQDFLVHPLPLGGQRRKEFEDHLLVFFTGLRRRAEELAARQVRRVPGNGHHLAALRGLVDDGYDALVGRASLTPFGELLHRAWLHKRELDPQVTNDTVDGLYREGLEAGALGGKLLGAGGGGFLLFFTPPDKQAAVRRRLSHLQEVRLETNAPGTHIILSRPGPEAFAAGVPADQPERSRRGRRGTRVAGRGHSRRGTRHPAAVGPA
jgi:D-glycero-alpha-D-manno-heptose-7-phosphate kinase